MQAGRRAIQEAFEAGEQQATAAAEAAAAAVQAAWEVWPLIQILSPSLKGFVLIPTPLHDPPPKLPRCLPKIFLALWFDSVGS